ncbi:MAG: hypothetical protein QM530_10710 [Phycisphaerales bacterium]|nr:hypothetical protein [Phycisphaerales bacterium]
MKKLLLSTALFLCAMASKAQYSSMTVINASTCSVDVTLYASFPYSGFAPCGLTSIRFVMPPGVTLTSPEYWNWHRVIPYAGLTAAPEPPLSSAVGIAPNYGVRGCFEWMYALIIPSWFTGSGGAPAPACSPNLTWGSPLACTSPIRIGTPCAGAPSISTSTWVNVGGDVTLTIN